MPPDVVTAVDLPICKSDDAVHAGRIVFKGRELDILLALRHLRVQDFSSATIASIAEVSVTFARRVLAGVVALGRLLRHGGTARRNDRVERPEASLLPHRRPWQHFRLAPNAWYSSRLRLHRSSPPTLRERPDR